MRTIRLGFVFYEVNWLGGVNYLRNLFIAIQSLPDKTIQPVLFAGMKADVIEFEGLAEIIRTSILDRYTPLWWISRFLVKVVPRRDYILYWLLRGHRINLLSHFGLLWRGCAIRAIGWIPDFQHMHLPSFFSPKVSAARNVHFKEIIRNADALIVSSQNAMIDLNAFDGQSKTPKHILRFVSCFSSNLRERTSRAELRSRYNLDRPWFHIPNQFWAHKNHPVVLEALHAIKQKNNNPLVIATGSTKDHRSKNYFSTVMQKVHDYGLQNDFRVLGVLPYPDVMELMRYAVAIINPSLYEGWSTTVEEAKAMGKQVILSNIAVHREQNPRRGVYFNVDDGDELARLMISAMEAYDEKKEDAFQSEAQKKQTENIMEFAKQYQSIILQTMGR